MSGEILAEIGQSGVTSVTMHDGSVVRFRSVPQNYDPSNRATVMSCLQEHQGRGEIVTGLLYLDESIPDVHEMNSTPDRALVDIPFEDLCPGSAALDKLQQEFQ
jgi:2-oxoglutarate ferredoxin oxidoreductase subunit beta